MAGALELLCGGGNGLERVHLVFRADRAFQEVLVTLCRLFLGQFDSSLFYFGKTVEDAVIYWVPRPGFVI